MPGSLPEHVIPRDFEDPVEVASMPFDPDEVVAFEFTVPSDTVPGDYVLYVAENDIVRSNPLTVVSP